MRIRPDHLQSQNRRPQFDSSTMIAVGIDHALDFAFSSLVSGIYQASSHENWQNLPHCRPFDHTMFDALDEYVAQKLLTAELYQALVEGRTTEIHGIYPDHFPLVADELGYSGITMIPFSPPKGGGALNYIRPRYFRANNKHGKPVLLVAVTPGRDYVRHYAGLVRHHLFHHTCHAESVISVVRYPEAERTLPLWTGLMNGFVANGEAVVVGYVQELADALLKYSGINLIDKGENQYYQNWRIMVGHGRVVNLLGVKFSFWGNIAATLCRSLCMAGVSEIIYVGKLGALSTPDDVYARVFCPSRFVIMNHQQIQSEVTSPPNGILKRFPAIDSGCHVSVPTVLEEDYLQRNVAGEVSASSIDNEISQMADTINDHNRQGSSEVRFSAIHFATDYVRKKSERHIHVPLNLSNNRTAVAREKKMAMLEHICTTYLCPYLCIGGRQ